MFFFPPTTQSLNMIKIIQDKIFSQFLYHVFLIMASGLVVLSTVHTVIDSSFISLSINSIGGAIYCTESYSKLLVNRCLFQMCSASNGGSIYCSSPSFEVENSCFLKSVATTWGQALFSKKCVYNLVYNSFSMSSYLENSGDYCTVELETGSGNISNINASKNYVSTHTPAIRFMGTGSILLSYFTYYLNDSPLGATLNFQKSTTICEVKYGNVIQCPIRASTGLIRVNDGNKNAAFFYVNFISNTGHTLICVVGTNSIAPSYTNCVFSNPISIIGSSVNTNCIFDTIGQQYTFQFERTGICYTDTKINTYFKNFQHRTMVLLLVNIYAY